MSNYTSWEESARLSAILLENIKARRAEIDEMAARFDKSEADAFYRFYHHSFKVFARQENIRTALQLFESLAPEQRALNGWFRTIIDNALKQTFEMHRTNEHWLSETLPILQAWAHCAAFLRALRWSAANLESSPQMLPDPWALTLYLYDCR